MLETIWPVVFGEYFIISRKASVAVSTLASGFLAESIAHSQPQGLSIIGKTETENIGIDKIVKNVISNPSIRFLIVAGEDSQGHQSGASLLALAKYGIDKNNRILNATGKRPVLMNTNAKEIEVFRQQLEVIDMIGCTNLDQVIAKIASLSIKQVKPFTMEKLQDNKDSAYTPEVIKIQKTSENEVTLDKEGYFVIIPECKDKSIIVEYYGYDNRLLKVIKGDNARDLYISIIKNGWISELSHAAYLGKELEKAQLSLIYGFKYVQDGA